jgi:hypothetical protein
MISAWEKLIDFYTNDIPGSAIEFLLITAEIAFVFIMFFSCMVEYADQEGKKILEKMEKQTDEK